MLARAGIYRPSDCMGTLKRFGLPIPSRDAVTDIAKISARPFARRPEHDSSENDPGQIQT